MTKPLPHTSPYSLQWPDSDPHAKWIRVVEDVVAPKGERPVYLLRKEIEVGGDVTAATIRATAQGLYEIYIDGIRIGDHQLTPGSTEYERQIAVQTFDVTDLLKPGNHAVVILLGDGWFRSVAGVFKTPDNFGGHVAALLEIELQGSNTSYRGTDSEWKVGPSHILKSDMLMGQVNDQRKYDPTVYKVGFDDASWDSPEVIQVSASLVAQFAPPVRAVERITPKSVKKLDDGVQVFDLGQNINGWVRLKKLGPVGTEVTLIHGETLDPATGDVTLQHLILEIPPFPPAPAGQVDVVTSAGIAGDYFEPVFATKGFQYVSVVGHPETLTVDDLEGVVVQSDLRKTGTFTSNNEQLNWLHAATDWSLRDNMCDVPTDCPTRERAGWTGDWQIFSPTAAYLYDINDFSRKWLADVVAGSSEDGNIPNIAPADKGGAIGGPMGKLNGAAGWGDAIVAVPLSLYNAYGDKRSLTECWDAMEKWLGYATNRAAIMRHPKRAEARPVALPHEQYLWDAPFHWGEWLEPNAEITNFGDFQTYDQGDVATAYIYRSAIQMQEIARILGRDGSKYVAMANNAKVAWQKEYITDDGLLNPDTQANYVRALDFGLAPVELRQKFADRLAEKVRAAGNHLGTGFLSTPYLLPVLADNGHADVAFDVLFQDTPPSWMYMKKKNATTVWEVWEGINDEGKAEASLNHYSKGAVISFLHHHIAGLKMTSPAYKSFVVKPLIGPGITEVQTTLDTPQGRIEVSWRIAETTFTLTVLAPEGTSSEAVLLDGSVHTLNSGSNTLTCQTLK